ncbi:MAG TPA: site-2 protease family protein [Acidimicrobiales bacterium]|nr:site-2 protease family protein [Acidimicrobiales bacterium]
MALVVRQVITTDTVLILAVLFGSVILHEVSHGAVANHFGDDTAKRAGRLTLNPVSHIDVFGTLILPAILVLAGGRPFGWAKPVPVTPSKLRSPRNHSLVVSLAGPAVNVALALLAALALRAVLPAQSPVGEVSLGVQLLINMGLVNVVLAVFNLIPIPPLDGSAMVERLLPATWWPGYLRLRQYSMVLLLVLVLMLPNALDRVFEPAIRFWANLVV